MLFIETIQSQFLTVQHICNLNIQNKSCHDRDQKHIITTQTGVEPSHLGPKSIAKRSFQGKIQ